MKYLVILETTHNCSLSSIKVEYCVMFKRPKESTQVKELVKDFGVFNDGLIPIFCDN